MAKKTHEAVNYGKGMAQSHCSICTHYVQPTKQDVQPHCKLVRDPIGRMDWCELFERAKENRRPG